MEQMLKDFLELTAIPVQSRQERQIADCLKKKLRDLGLTVVEEPIAVADGTTGNIRAVLEGTCDAEPILFSAHMDRVKNNEAISPYLEEESQILRADGKTILAADDVSGICVILEALRRLKASQKPYGTVEVAFSVCEEVGVLGSKHFDFDAFSAKKAYVFDAPGHIGKMVLQAPAKAKFAYRIYGKSAHAGNEPEKGINAIRAAADLVLQLPDSRLTPFSTANIANFHGGTGATNVVCDFAEVVAEARSTDSGEFARILEAFSAPVEKIEKKYGVRIEYVPAVLYPTFKREKEEPMVQLAARAMENLGISPVYARGGGGMDGNHFNAKGIHSIGIATGYFKNHTPQEHLYLEDFYQCGALAAEIVWENAK